MAKDGRYNQTLVNVISKYVHEHREICDELLGEIVYSYNTAVQVLTKHTTFEAMLGRRGDLPNCFQCCDEL